MSINTNSTFEEVESIDLNGSHEMELLTDIGHDRRESFTGISDHLQQISTTNSPNRSPRSQRRNSRHMQVPQKRPQRLQDQGYSLDECVRDGLGIKSMGRTRGRDLIAPVDTVADELPYTRHQKLSPVDAVVAAGTPRDYPEHHREATPRNLLEQLLHQRKYLGSDSISPSTSFNSSMSITEPTVKYPYENDYEFHVRKRRMSTCSSISGYEPTPNNGPTTRMSSFDSTSGSLSSSQGSPLTDSMYYIQQTPPAEDVLTNLGFGIGESFLPERFAKDWYAKIMQARQDRIQQFQEERLAEFYDSLDIQSIMSGKSSPRHRLSQTGESIAMHTQHLNSQSAQGQQQMNPKVPPRHHLGSNFPRKLRRANTFSSFEDDSSFDNSGMLDYIIMSILR